MIGAIAAGAISAFVQAPITADFLIIAGGGGGGKDGAGGGGAGGYLNSKTGETSGGG